MGSLHSAFLGIISPALTLLSSLLTDWGELRLAQQQPPAASALFTEAQNVAQAAGIQHLVALALYGLARASEARGDRTTARDLGQQSQAILTILGNPRAAEVQQWLAALPEG